MIRKTLTILSLIGLLLSVGLWGVSYLRVHCEGPYITLMLTHGCWVFGYDPESAHKDWDCGYFGFRDFTTFPIPFCSRDGRGFSFVLPFWLSTLLFGFLCVWRAHPFSRRRRRKRKKLGLCIRCGYDLRGSKGRCPECGTPFEG